MRGKGGERNKKEQRKRSGKSEKGEVDVGGGVLVIFQAVV